MIIHKDTRPDLDNLTKNLLDVCNGVLWIDDSQIVEMWMTKKIFGEVPRIELDFFWLGGDMYDTIYNDKITKRNSEVDRIDR